MSVAVAPAAASSRPLLPGEHQHMLDGKLRTTSPPQQHMSPRQVRRKQRSVEIDLNDLTGGARPQVHSSISRHKIRKSTEVVLSEMRTTMNNNNQAPDFARPRKPAPVNDENDAAAMLAQMEKPKPYNVDQVREYMKRKRSTPYDQLAAIKDLTKPLHAFEHEAKLDQEPPKRKARLQDADPVIKDYMLAKQEADRARRAQEKQLEEARRQSVKERLRQLEQVRKAQRRSASRKPFEYPPEATNHALWDGQFAVPAVQDPPANISPSAPPEPVVAPASLPATALPVDNNSSSSKAPVTDRRPSFDRYDGSSLFAPILSVLDNIIHTEERAQVSLAASSADAVDGLSTVHRQPSPSGTASIPAVSSALPPVPLSPHAWTNAQPDISLSHIEPAYGHHDRTSTGYLSELEPLSTATQQDEQKPAVSVLNASVSDTPATVSSSASVVTQASSEPHSELSGQRRSVTPNQTHYGVLSNYANMPDSVIDSEAQTSTPRQSRRGEQGSVINIFARRKQDALARLRTRKTPPPSTAPVQAAPEGPGVQTTSVAATTTTKKQVRRSSPADSLAELMTSLSEFTASESSDPSVPSHSGDVLLSSGSQTPTMQSVLREQSRPPSPRALAKRLLAETEYLTAVHEAGLHTQRAISTANHLISIEHQARLQHSPEIPSSDQLASSSSQPESAAQIGSQTESHVSIQDAEAQTAVTQAHDKACQTDLSYPPNSQMELVAASTVTETPRQAVGENEAERQHAQAQELERISRDLHTSLQDQFQRFMEQFRSAPSHASAYAPDSIMGNQLLDTVQRLERKMDELDRRQLLLAAAQKSERRPTTKRKTSTERSTIRTDQAQVQMEPAPPAQVPVPEQSMSDQSPPATSSRSSKGDDSSRQTRTRTSTVASDIDETTASHSVVTSVAEGSRVHSRLSSAQSAIIEELHSRQTSASISQVPSGSFGYTTVSKSTTMTKVSDPLSNVDGASVSKSASVVSSVRSRASRAEEQAPSEVTSNERSAGTSASAASVVDAITEGATSDSASAVPTEASPRDDVSSHSVPATMSRSTSVHTHLTDASKAASSSVSQPSSRVTSRSGSQVLTDEAASAPADDVVTASTHSEPASAVPSSQPTYTPFSSQIDVEEDRSEPPESAVSTPELASHPATVASQPSAQRSALSASQDKDVAEQLSMYEEADTSIEESKFAASLASAPDDSVVSEEGGSRTASSHQPSRTASVQSIARSASQASSIADVQHAAADYSESFASVSQAVSKSASLRSVKSSVSSISEHAASTSLAPSRSASFRSLGGHPASRSVSSEHVSTASVPSSSRTAGKSSSHASLHEASNQDDGSTSSPSAVPSSGDVTSPQQTTSQASLHTADQKGDYTEDDFEDATPTSAHSSIAEAVSETASEAAPSSETGSADAPAKTDPYEDEPFESASELETPSPPKSAGPSELFSPTKDGPADLSTFHVAMDRHISALKAALTPPTDATSEQQEPAAEEPAPQVTDELVDSIYHDLMTEFLNETDRQYQQQHHNYIPSSYGDVQYATALVDHLLSDYPATDTLAQHAHLRLPYLSAPHAMFGDPLLNELLVDTANELVQGYMARFRWTPFGRGRSALGDIRIQHLRDHLRAKMAEYVEYGARSDEFIDEVIFEQVRDMDRALVSARQQRRHMGQTLPAAAVVTLPDSDKTPALDEAVDLIAESLLDEFISELIAV